MERDDILLFLKKHKPTLRQEYGVERIGLFGSYARLAADRDSDIDIAVEFADGRKTLGNFLGLKRYLEQHLGKSVDLGIESTLKPVVRDAVKKDMLYA
jgi:predicted nucleotidyltransferase